MDIATFYQLIPLGYELFVGGNLVYKKGDPLLDTQENLERYINDLKASYAFNTISPTYGISPVENGVTATKKAFAVADFIEAVVLVNTQQNYQRAKTWLDKVGETVNSDFSNITQRFKSWLGNVFEKCKNALDNAVIGDNLNIDNGVGIGVTTNLMEDINRLATELANNYLENQITVTGEGSELRWDTREHFSEDVCRILVSDGYLSGAYRENYKNVYGNYPEVSLTVWNQMQSAIQNNPYKHIVVLKNDNNLWQLFVMFTPFELSQFIVEFSEAESLPSFLTFVPITGDSVRTGGQVFTDPSSVIELSYSYAYKNIFDFNYYLGETQIQVTTGSHIAQYPPINQDTENLVQNREVFNNQVKTGDKTYTFPVNPLIANSLLSDEYIAVGDRADAPPIVWAYPQTLDALNGLDVDGNDYVDAIPTSINVYPADTRTNTTIGTTSKTIDEARTDAKTQNETKKIIDPTPNVPMVGGNGANKMFTLYAINDNKLDQLGGYIWGNTFLTALTDNLLKLFSNPVEAIISLNAYPLSIGGSNIAKIPINGSQNIKLCNIDSGISANVVDGYFTTISMGRITISKYFNNFMDYSPYTKISLYLPFIGIVPLDADEVMNSTIEVVYRVEFITGNCLALVKVTKDNLNETVMYQYSGNMAIQLPVTSANYSRLAQSLIGIGAGAIATYATGGATAPLLLGGLANGVGNLKPDIQKSGNMNGNVGCLGSMKPYLIFDRPVVDTPNNYTLLKGVPTNKYVSINTLNGHVEFDEIHVDIANATDEEKNMIETLLKSGIEI